MPKSLTHTLIKAQGYESFSRQPLTIEGKCPWGQAPEREKRSTEAVNQNKELCDVLGDRAAANCDEWVSSSEEADHHVFEERAEIWASSRTATIEAVLFGAGLRNGRATAVFRCLRPPSSLARLYRRGGTTPMKKKPTTPHAQAASLENVFLPP
mgnify:CR=1 FL=1